MKFYLDTNICVYFLKGVYPQLRDKLLSYNPERIKIPSLTKAELLHGAEKSKNRTSNLEKIHEFLFPFEIQGFTDAETSIYAKIRLDLENKGNIIGPNDLQIASIVLTNKGTLITHNKKELNRVKGLLVEDWTI